MVSKFFHGTLICFPLLSRSADILRDAITPTQDFIISNHVNFKGLYIATAGSFHGWKFLPIIGRYVVEMLDGELDNVLRERWAWDRPLRGLTQPKSMPKRDLNDIS